MKRKQLAEEDIAVEFGSDNIFADLGLEDAEQLLVKSQFAVAIIREIREQGWTQKKAAERTGLTQPEVSNIKRAKLDGFSQERLQAVLCRLGMDVEITARRRRSGAGTLTFRPIAS